MRTLENLSHWVEDEYLLRGAGSAALTDGWFLCWAADNGTDVSKVARYCGVADVDGKIGDGVGTYA